jgi:hypothetical protein
MSASDKMSCARPNGVQAPLGIRAIAHDVTQTQHCIGARLRLLQGKQCLPIRMQITKNDNTRHMQTAITLSEMSRCAPLEADHAH